MKIRVRNNTLEIYDNDLQDWRVAVGREETLEYTTERILDILNIDYEWED